MSGNIIAFLTALVLGAVAFGFGLQSKKQLGRNKQWLVLFMWLLSLFLILNAYFAFNGWRSLRTLNTMPPLKTSGDLMRSDPGEDVILVGSVSEENQVLRAEDVVAYFECGEPCYLFYSPPLSINLSGVNAQIENRDFQEREWAYERGLTYSYYNLRVNDPVVVIGQQSDSSIHAEVIFRGEYDQFLTYTQGKIRQAGVMMWINAIVSASFIGVGFAYWEPKNNPLKQLLNLD